MNRRSTSGAIACAVALAAVPNAAPAATDYYTPPKLKSQGKNTTPVAGPGVVVIKVLVNKDGSAKVQGVIRSTNHGDDAAALEVAKSSTYRPATKGSTPILAFYDFSLKFKTRGGSAASADTGAGSATGLAQYELMIRSGNYSGAQSGLKSYVAAHPSDTKGYLDLGIANAYLNDPQAAAAAFDRAGTIPDSYKPIAAKAYNDAAGEAYKKQDFTAAVAAGKRAVELAPGPFTYNTLGTAEDAAGDHAAAVTDLEKARSLAAADTSLKPADRARIGTNLVSAYVGAGKPELAKPIVDEVTKMDPSQTGAQVFLGNYYSKLASDASNAGKFEESASLYEQAAAVAPSQAVQLYTSAALSYLKVKANVQNDKAKADADKALAVDPDNAAANYAAGVALANQPGKTKDALTYLNRADASAKKGSDPSLTAAIENVLKQLSGSK